MTRHPCSPSSVACGLLVLLCSCHAAPDLAPFPGNAAAGVPLPAAEFLLTSGDRLEVRFPLYPEWNTAVLIQPDGRGSFPIAGDVPAAGRSLAAVRSAVVDSLRTRIRNPEIEVALKELHKREVFVGGEVDYPGAVEFQTARLTLAEAVFARGGPLWRTAELRTVVLSRVTPDGQRNAWLIDLHQNLFEGVAMDPVLLSPGDVVLVPATSITRANAFVEQYINNMLPANAVLGAVLSVGTR